MEILWDNEKLKKAEKHGSLLSRLAKLHYYQVYQKYMKCYNDIRELDRQVYPFGYKKYKETHK